MAVNITSTYAGHALTPLLTAMFDTMREVQNGDVTLHNDVNYKKVLRKMTSANLLQADSAGFTPAGDLTETEAILFPTIQKVNLQIDKNDFRSEWSSVDMGAGQMNKKMAADINEAIAKNILGTVGEGLRAQMWVDDTTALPEGGLLYQLKTAGYNKVADVAAITKDNVLEELAKVLAAIPVKVLDFDKTRLFVASDVYHAYAAAVADQSNGLSSVDKIALVYNGYKMVIVPEFAAGEVVLANKDNLHFGTDIFSDFSEVMMLDQEYVTGAAQVHYVQRVAIDVKVGFTNECAFRAV